ncbi:hypothetical protein SDC9_174451 [bioreactor metagenome]|uniref:Uncharacterized protein n=1 Tax=bioreactor metagenome TaxID=1076179 RepID=A0A645GSP3_9ZZZZ
MRPLINGSELFEVTACMRSIASLMAASGRPIISIDGNPLSEKHSTVTVNPSSPESDAEYTVVSMIDAFLRNFVFV